MARDNYTAIRIKTDVNQELRRLVRRVSAEVDRDVALSEAVSAAVAVALEHLGEVAARLGATTHDGGSDK
jgi:hypothetical protein